MKTALVIMAAGIGSRFGGGIKQLEPVGLHGEIIMDYSIHDALKAGFNKIVFIIRKDLEEDFKQVIGSRIEKLCARRNVEVEYAFQEVDDLPEGVKVPEGRTKPWGTGQAVLACRNIVKEPFAVINADDYYGKEGFVKIHDFLSEYDPADPMKMSMVGFVLKNTLSDNGTVSRGICHMNSDDYLTDVVETTNIMKKVVDGRVMAQADGKEIAIDSIVSMNMWGLTPEFMDALKEGFEEFFREMEDGKQAKAEYYLPKCIDEQIHAGKGTVKVLKTHDKWFGVTYKEDKEAVVASFKKLIEQGVYEEELFSDL